MSCSQRAALDKGKPHCPPCDAISLEPSFHRALLEPSEPLVCRWFDAKNKTKENERKGKEKEKKGTLTLRLHFMPQQLVSRSFLSPRPMTSQRTDLVTFVC